MTPRVFIAVPIYKGWDFVGGALRSLQAQTLRDFAATLSVDGDDERSADACRPFLSDSRFTLIVRGEHLRWVRQMNTLIDEAQLEYFCYLQQDDLIHPTYLERLVATMDAHPRAALAFSDMRWIGDKRGVERHAGIDGLAVDRVRDYAERLLHSALRGLIRRDAIARAGYVFAESGGLCQDHVWLARIAREGAFVRVPGALYDKRIHAANLHGTWFKQSRRHDERRVPWVHFGAGMIEILAPMSERLEDRWRLVAFMLDRLIRPGPGRWTYYEPYDGDPPREFAVALAADAVAHVRARGALDLPALLDAPWEDIAPRALDLAYALRPTATHDRALLRDVKRMAFGAVGKSPSAGYISAST